MAHVRLVISILIGAAVAFTGSFIGSRSVVTAAIAGYDVGAIVYVAWAFLVMSRSTVRQIRKSALEQDDGKVFVLVFAVTALVFSTSAIFVELGSVKQLEGTAKYGCLILALTTIVASWFFTATIFALHYAHDYYFQVEHGRDGGLVFLPADVAPTYWDFMYFSLILNATAQTADVTLSSSQMRKTCTLHSILAFFFNTTLLALAINMASGLIGG